MFREILPLIVVNPASLNTFIFRAYNFFLSMFVWWPAKLFVHLFKMIDSLLWIFVSQRDVLHEPIYVSRTHEWMMTPLNKQIES